MTNAQVYKRLQDSGFILKEIIGSAAIWTKGSISTKGPSRANSNSADIGWLHKVQRALEEARLADVRAKQAPRKPTAGEIRVGSRVRSRRVFVDVPAGTVGTISEDYRSGFTVAWDRPGQQPLTDSFDKASELHYLELV